MDDSDIVVLDSSEEEFPVASNAFTIASPQICQTWIQSSHNQNQQKARNSSLQTVPKFWRSPKADIHPQPIITSVKSLSPLKTHKPFNITEVKSLSHFNKQLPSRSLFQNQKPAAATFFPSGKYQPSVTEVKSMIHLKNKKVTNSLTISEISLLNVKSSAHRQSSISMSSSNVQPECIILDEDEGNNGCSKVSKLSSNSSEWNDSAEVKPCSVESPYDDSMTNDIMSFKFARNEEAVSDSTTSSPRKRRIRPTPVMVKEHKTNTIDDFIKACLAVDQSEEMSSILTKKVKKYHDNCDLAFLSSSSFDIMLQKLLKKVESDKSNIYVYIADICNELKARKVQVSHQSGKSPPMKRRKTKADSEVDYVALEEARTELKIKKLSKTLTKLQKMIKQLEEKEVSWEDDEDSAYIMTQRYKERAVKVYQKLCEYTKESKSAGSIDKIHLSCGTHFPQVNKCVERFVNSTGKFPDFVDILDLIKKINSEDNINLSDSEIENTARNVFQEVGEEMQRQRQHGVAESLLSFIESQSDPADSNIELEKELKKNAKHWQKINEVIDDFASRSIKKKGSGNSNESGDEEDDQENDDEDEEKTDEEDEVKTDEEDEVKTDEEDEVKTDEEDEVKTDEEDEVKSDEENEVKTDEEDEEKNDKEDEEKNDEEDEEKNDKEDEEKNDKEDEEKNDKEDEEKNDKEDEEKNDKEDEEKNDDHSVELSNMAASDQDLECDRAASNDKLNDEESLDKTKTKSQTLDEMSEEPDSAQDAHVPEFIKGSGERDENIETACAENVSSASIGEHFRQDCDGVDIGLENHDDKQIMTVKSELLDSDLPRIRVRSARSLGGKDFDGGSNGISRRHAVHSSGSLDDDIIILE